jgi:Na+/H+ antiporter NhaD/arsenite permease-like protein
MATRREWIFDLVMLLVGVVLTIESLRLGLGTLHHPGPGFLPILTGTVLSFVALLCLFKNLLAAREENDTDGEKFFSRPLINVLKISIALIVYVHGLGIY